jgi:YHS domain-containing protein
LIHEGRTYLFAGRQQRDRFDAAPDRYAPVLSGADVVLAVEQGATVPGRREHGVWFEDRVYLFSSEATLWKFDAAPYRYVSAIKAAPQNTARRWTGGNPAIDGATPDSAPMMRGGNPASVPHDPYGRWR